MKASLFVYLCFSLLCVGHGRGSDDEPKRQPNSQPQAQPGVELAAHRHHPQGGPSLDVS